MCKHTMKFYEKIRKLADQGLSEEVSLRKVRHDYRRALHLARTKSECMNKHSARYKRIAQYILAIDALLDETDGDI